MAECTISRCSHERRVFRKELHKWSKEILYILGLERLAEELMGARKWRILVQPFTDLESETPVDWLPEDTCYFCNAKKQPPYDPASGIIPTVDGYNSLRIDTDEHSVSSDQGTVSGSFTSCASALSPWRIAALSSQGVSNSPPLLDQPLDLSISSLKQSLNERMVCSNKSRHSKHTTNYADDSDMCTNPVLKVPQIPLKPGHRRRLDANSKRSYTEDELQAALRDIQSGKLGTRRAAVIYGIPRSTLRNKVYKLANESKSRAHGRRIQPSESIAKNREQNKSFNLNTELEVPVYDSENNKHNVSSASESLRQLLKHTITQKVQSASKVSENKLNSDNSIHIARMSDVDSMDELQVFSSLEYSQTLAPVLSHVFSDIQHLALVKSKENIHCTSQSLSALKDDLKLPLLPDIIRRLAEERMEFEKDPHKDSDVDNHGELTELPSSGTLSSNVILKVPSFKPAKSPPMSNETDDPCLPVVSSSSPPPGTSSHSHSGNKGITVTLKELISRSISQKISNSLKDRVVDDDPSVEFSYSMSNMDSPACNLPWGVESSSKEGKEVLSNTNNSSNSSDSSKSEKRTRPKRGRYRNYDRDNLARAVRAVQKGEMSVHRAGTFYGVPHSTLEYKVKERHLLRPRKRDVFNSTAISDASEPVSTSKLNSFSVENSMSVKNLKNNINQIAIEASNGLSTDSEQPHRPTMGSYPSPLSLWQSMSMPFLSLDFSQLGSNNFFASQMMRKLQENARLHEEMQKKRKGQDFGLIENLIKSTLERSMSPDSKSPLLLSADSVESLSGYKGNEDIKDK
ncbi:mushroom body large-type Kenyon cell-specific protein 1-like [Argiope bruennichi]|uniref:Mushroom body large-type Kenyon cell-specific like protein n=1 Tax=Argiope bruennichi TaxID=94029 RepID=A0A8T0FHI9_ARGBR|nr:mushroom body large-type Kenyon cell-specific protein 1-like [Argiope bruennichi]KAF8790461.1 Mushroom body large-type Kenyon cell-specific like protein [Argiope bruennichi]